MVHLSYKNNVITPVKVSPVCRLYYVTVKQHSTDSDRFSLRKLVSVANDNNIVLKVSLC